MLSALSPARRRLVLALLAAAAVVLAAVIVAAVAVRTSGSGPVRPVAQDQPGPVVLVPGYGGSTGGLAVLAGRLEQSGRTAEVMPLPDGGTGDLRVQARALRSTVDALLARTHAASVDVIGYSAGGVVARLWVRDYGGASQARRVITLGSPHHGTDLAGLAGSLVPGVCPAACQQLEPGSSLLDALNSGDETPAGPVFVSIWTTVDQTVVPPDSARLAGAVDLTVQGVCASSTVAHGQLPTDPLVTGMVLAEIGPAAPTQLGAGDCERLSS